MIDIEYRVCEDGQYAGGRNMTDISRNFFHSEKSVLYGEPGVSSAGYRYIQ